MAWPTRLVLLPILALGLLSPADAAPVASGTPAQRTFRIQAGDFAFHPSRLTVDRGDRVTLTLESTDFVHGLYIEGYDLEVQAEPGLPAELSFVADRPGSFRLRCSVSCGSLHPFMTGRLQVGPSPFLPTLALAAAAVALGGLVLGRYSPRREPSSP